MKLAYSSNAFTRTDLPSAIRHVAELGYQGIEILCDRPHWFPGEVPPEEVDEIAELLGRHGLAVSNLNANTATGYFDPLPPENVFEPALCNPDAELRAWRREFTVHAMHLARAVGAKCVSVTSGRPRPGTRPEASLELFVDSLRRLCDEAERLDVNLGVEYEPGLLVERATELAEVIHRVGSPRLGANLDIGHSFLDGEAPRDATTLLAGRIWNVHVEDIRGRKHFHLPPGEGDLPFAEYFSALGSVGFDGFLTVELYSFPDSPVEVGRQAIEHLRPLAARA